MRFPGKALFSANLFVLALFLAPVLAFGQDANANAQVQKSLTGKYQGTAKDATGEGKATLDLVDESGKFSGSITTGLGTFKIIKGQMVDGSLTLEFETTGPPHKMTVRPKDDLLVGNIFDAGKTAAIELRKVTADEISGEWDAAADAQGQAFPFTLVLKLEGEKVTGSSSSSLGNSNISTGIWKDGKLTIVLDGTSGAIGLVATLEGGKLVGDYDYAGQLQGKWVGIRKK